MGKLYIFIFFFLYLVIFSARTIYALSPFEKYSDNPLVFNSTYANWNEIGGVQPYVTQESSSFKMWYTSYNGSSLKIAYAISNDALTWTKNSILDIDATFWNHDPSILKTSSDYIIFFGSSNTESGYRIRRINSPDGINVDSTSLLTILIPGSGWESSAISAPFVLKDNSDFYMFYSGTSSGYWKIGLAKSTDGISWLKCSNNPIINPGDSPTILKKNNIYYLFFHSPYGIRYVESSDSLGCNMSWSSPTTVITSSEWYDQNTIIAPAVLEVDQSIYLYYAGLGTDNKWHVNLAISGQQPPSDNPIVILPGFLGSWNKDAVVYRKEVNYSDWKMNPVFQDYNGLKNTLINLGLQENQDFYFFPYDWRKKLEDTATDLDSFLTQTVKPAHQNSDINLLGHSLGGMVARIFGQKFGTNDVNKIITVGSPHLGTVQTYKAVEAGTLDRGNDLNGNLMWLAQKLALKLYTDGINTDRQIINTYFPSVKDIFPVYQFLTDQNNQPITLDQMTVQNDTLLPYQNSFPDLFPKLQTIIGEKGNTLSGYQVKSRSLMDVILDLYPDGHPQQSRNQTGDYLITSLSAKADSDAKILPLDHGELIYKKEGLQAILSSLGLQYSESQIAEGTGTKITPSLLFLILSPAEIEASFGGQNYPETEGIILIQDAQSGQYQLKVKGKQPGGPYTVLVGQIGTSTDIWSKIVGTMNTASPQNQIDSYSIHFDSQNPEEFPVNSTDIDSLFNLLIKKLETLNQNNDRNIDQATKFLTDGKVSFSRSDWSTLRRNLLSAHQNLFQSVNLQYLEAIFELENLYAKSLIRAESKPSKSHLENELERYQKTANSLESLLLERKGRGKDVIQQGQNLLVLKEHLEKVKDVINEDSLNLAEILLETSGKLIHEIR